MKKLNYEIKEQMVALSGACFWFWTSFHSFLSSCGVPRQLLSRYPKATYSKYDVMRNVLEYMDEHSQAEVLHRLVSGFYRLSGPIDKDNLDSERAKRLLAEFRKSVGNDPIERALEEQQRKKRIDEAKSRTEILQAKSRALDALKNKFLDLHTNSSLTPQQRGFALEPLFFDLLAIEEFEYTNPYRAEGEQIDGAFSYNKFDYLVEVKWVKTLVKQDALSIFDGKIRGKAQSTRGLFIAINGFDENAVSKYSGDRPRIVLMNGSDLMKVLENRISFFDLMKSKVDALVRFGKIYHTK